MLTVTFANKKRKPVLKVGSATVSLNWRFCWGLNKWGIPSDLGHFLIAFLFVLYALFLKGFAWVLLKILHPDLGTLFR